jgi:hypothetical protein
MPSAQEVSREERWKLVPKIDETWAGVALLSAVVALTDKGVLDRQSSTWTRYTEEEGS